MGARESGAKGFIKGVGAGLVAVVVLPVSGVVVGGVQMVRGAANTPNALKQSSAGKHWDGRTRQWVDYDPKMALVTEESIKAKPSSNPFRHMGEGDDKATSENGDGSNKKFYTMLQVEQDASSSDIKKAYYKLAREYHPDKNPDNPEASEKFQNLSQAYQVLSNPKLREEYDLNGDDSINKDSMMDSGLFFTMLFGSDRFDDLIGELYITTTARLGMSNELELERSQVNRVTSLATTLEKRLLVWELGEHDKFVAAAVAEAESLLTASYGAIILNAVGEAYVNAAQKELGGLSGISASFRSFGQSMGRYYAVAKAASKAVSLQKKVEAASKETQSSPTTDDQSPSSTGPTTDSSTNSSPPSSPSNETEETEKQDNMTLEQKADFEKQFLPVILKALWSGNAIDIASVLQKVTKAVLKGGHGVDPVEKTTRAVRARGLLELGKVFSSVGEKEPSDTTESNDADAARDTFQQAAFATQKKQSDLD